MSTITVATFNEMERADLVKQKLADAGIKAEVCDERRLQRFFFGTKPQASAKVRVEEEDYERARTILEGVDAQEHVLDGSIACPKCGSPRIEYPQFTRKFAVPMLVEVFTLTGLGEKKFYCKECQYTWCPEIHPDPERDELGWPKKA